jgi:hypothetical protein
LNERDGIVASIASTEELLKTTAEVTDATLVDGDAYEALLAKLKK